jgi:hypothetical protein
MADNLDENPFAYGWWMRGEGIIGPRSASER